MRYLSGTLHSKTGRKGNKALPFFGVDIRYLMIGCLAASLVYDVDLLNRYPFLTLVPIVLGFIYHLQHVTVKNAVIAFFTPFAPNIIEFVKGDIKKYDILDLSMIGVIMGWSFFHPTSVLEKVLNSVLQGA